MDSVSSLENLLLNIFLALCALTCLVCLLEAPQVVELSVKYNKLIMNWHGYEVEIKPTQRAVTLCQIWNGILFVGFLVLVTLPK